LPDGSKVWLNNTSSIKFPVTFVGNTRTVELTGEAYFEVAKNRAKPFHVIIPPVQGGPGGAVEVLGTHFNIMAYGEEEAIKTTLLEGSVKVVKRDAGKEESTMLKPGEQAVMAANSPLAIDHSPDLDATIAWKNGKFYFNNADIKVIMRQIARWYDVDVEYRNISAETQLGGVVSRKEDLRQLLNYFEIAGKVHFTIEGRKIIVTR
jgi:ferric-dicitrate binding protein FerR (iron transport regulator)